MRERKITVRHIQGKNGRGAGLELKRKIYK